MWNHKTNISVVSTIISGLQAGQGHAVQTTCSSLLKMCYIIVIMHSYRLWLLINCDPDLDSYYKYTLELINGNSCFFLIFWYWRHSLNISQLDSYGGGLVSKLPAYVTHHFFHHEVVALCHESTSSDVFCDGYLSYHRSTRGLTRSWDINVFRLSNEYHAWVHELLFTPWQCRYRA